MIKKSLLFWIAGSLLFLSACNGNQSDDTATAGEEEPGMEQFAVMKTFRRPTTSRPNLISR